MSDLVKTAVCDGIEMDYAVFGDVVPGTGSCTDTFSDQESRTLVIVPGMSLHSVMQSAQIVAHAFAPFVKAGYVVYLFDRKKDFGDRYSVNEMAEDTFKVMSSLGINKADVYGTSQGGMIALSLAVHHPEVVRRLSIASTLARQNTTSIATMKIWLALSAGDSPVELNRDIFRRVYSPEFHNRYEKAFSRLESDGTPEEMRRFGVMAVASMEFDIYDELDRIKCPVCIFGVEDDTVLSGDGVREIAEVLHCPLRMYPGKGHAAYDEDPHFVKDLLEFFV